MAKIVATAVCRDAILNSMHLFGKKLGCGSLADSCGAFFKLIHSFITFQEGFKVVDL